MFNPVRPPYLIRRYYSRFTWSIPNEERKVYLTFDDGPIPEVTEFVLDILAEHNVKATFFCIGKNVSTNPDIYKRILDNGHRTGNHTHFHKNGWLTSADDYANDVNQAASLITSDLFRPPYGRIKKSQADSLTQHYKIIMWDVLSYDFLESLTPEQCLKNVTTNTRPGSVIVFHDSVKAFPRMKKVLPAYLRFLKDQQFIPEIIP